MCIESVTPSNYLILCRPFLLLLSIFPSTRVSSMSQFFTTGSQSIGVSASASVFPVNIQDQFPLGWTGWISSQSKGPSRVFSNTTAWSHQFSPQPSLWFSSHLCTWSLEKPYLLTICTFVGRVMSQLFNMLSKLVITFYFQETSIFEFHGYSHHPQWFWSPRKWSLSLFPFFPPSICREVMGPDDVILVFLMLNFKLHFHSPLSPSSRGSLVPLCFLH